MRNLFILLFLTLFSYSYIQEKSISPNELENKLLAIHGRLFTSSKNDQDSLKISLILKEVKKSVNNQSSNYLKIVYNSILGKINERLYHKDQALLYYKKADSLSELESQNHKIIYQKYYINHSIAELYEEYNFPEQSIENYKKALGYTLELKDQNKEIEVYNNLAVLMLNYQEYNKALNYQNKALSLALNINNKELICKSYINLGTIYTRTEKKKQAISYFNKANTITINTDINSLKVDYYNAFGEYFLINGQPEQAKKIFESSIPLATKGNDYFGLMNANGILGEYYRETNILLMRDYFLKAKKYANKGHYTKAEMDLTLDLAQIENSLKNYTQANLYYQDYVNLTESEIQKNSNFIDAENKFTIELRDQTIKQQETIKVLYLVALILVLLISVLGYFYYRNQLKIKNKEKLLIEESKKLEVSNALLAGQEEERSRIAKEIHDGIGGQLAGIKLMMGEVNINLNNKTIDKIINILTNTTSELRTISHNLSPNYIKNKNLIQLLTDLKEQYKIKKEFHIELIIYPEQSFITLDFTLKHGIYRIIQELLNNIDKYAKAKNIELLLSLHDKTINIIVGDDGIGFDVNHSKGIGLKNIEERIKMMRGSVKIESTMGVGTQIIINLPLN